LLLRIEAKKQQPSNDSALNMTFVTRQNSGSEGSSQGLKSEDFDGKDGKWTKSRSGGFQAVWGEV
jgi:hypothetical protein